MSKPYVMPSLGAGMEAGTVVEWHVEPGQKVTRGEVVGLVDTEKGAIEIEIWEDAEVEEIVAPPGTKVPVGEPLLRLKEAGGEAAEGEETPAAAGEPEETEEPEEPEEAEEPAAAGDDGDREGREEGDELAATTPDEDPEIVEEVWAEEAEEEAAAAAPPSRQAPSPPTEPVRRLRVTPVARKRAAELEVELEGIQGTGPGGAISLADVESAAGAEGAPPREAPEETALEPDVPEAGADRHAAMRKAIATAMTRSKREIPHYYLAHTTSMEPALKWLETTNQARPPAQRLLLAALYLKAVATALREFQEFNGFWEDDIFRPAEGIHPGVAISLRGGGLVAPAIHDVDSRSLDDITGAIRDLVQRSRAGHLRGSEVADPTITVTSLGDRGVDQVFGVIYPPQVAIVGIGSTVERPWAQGGMVGTRRVAHLTLAADHRASDGHRGALFLEAVTRLLQTPGDL
jgi:pyruvate dehydrogenase E2 component (dihydrolipoamide acetyltransferase)